MHNWDTEAKGLEVAGCTLILPGIIYMEGYIGFADEQACISVETVQEFVTADEAAHVVRLFLVPSIQRAYSPMLASPAKHMHSAVKNVNNLPSLT